MSSLTMVVVMNNPGVDLCRYVYNLTSQVDSAYVEVTMRGSSRGVVYRLTDLYKMSGDERMLIISNALLKEFEYDRRGIHYVTVIYARVFLH